MNSLVKFDIVNSKNELILPITYEKYDINKVKYGLLTKNINVKYHTSHRLLISKELAKELFINKKSKYQIYAEKNTLNIGPLIGFLLGDNTHLYSTKHMEKYSDRLRVLSVTGGTVCAFSSRTIDYEGKKVYGLIYDVKSRKWRYAKTPIPSIIYRRSFKSQKVVNKLRDDLGCTVFNSHKVIKSGFYTDLLRNYKMKEYIPKTTSVENSSIIINFLDKHKKVILKPKALSRGRGIVILELIGSDYNIYDYSIKPFKTVKISGKSAFKEFLMNRKDLLDDYLIQKYINLAQINNANFDIRIVVQKNLEDEWECTGIECRLSSPDLLITNVSLGGKALFIFDALKKSFPKMTFNEIKMMTKKIIDLSIKTAQTLETKDKNFFEFGIDMAIDKDKKLWLIEANVFPSFKGFKSFDMKTYIKIRERPILYAAKKAGFKV